jgi:protein phosphatase
MTSEFARRFEAAGLTDTGRRRADNEDSLLIDEDMGLLLVADGMGGHATGKLASQTAIEAILDFLYEYDPELFAASALPGAAPGPADGNPTNQASATADNDDTTVVEEAPVAFGVIQAAITISNRKINQMNRAQQFPDGSGMGTTIVGLWLLPPGTKVLAFHVGDSRIYRFRGGRLMQITRDHTLYQEWLASGGQGVAPRQNIITRAIGPLPDVEPEMSVQSLRTDDIYLLCSDGLTGMVDDKVIEQMLSDQSDLQGLCEALIQLANERGGTDNITVTLARCR